MVNWSETILLMVDDGESYEKIIAHFNHPVVNEEFVKNAVHSRHMLTRQRTKHTDHPRKTMPGEGTGLRIVWDYAQKLGGLDEFYHHIYHGSSQAAVARELGIDGSVVRRFVRDFYRGFTKCHADYLGLYPDMHRRVKMQQLQAGTYKPKPKRLTVKVAKELW